MVLCRQYAYNMQIRQTIIITAGKDLKSRVECEISIITTRPDRDKRWRQGLTET